MGLKDIFGTGHSKANSKNDEPAPKGSDKKQEKSEDKSEKPSENDGTTGELSVETERDTKEQELLQKQQSLDAREAELKEQEKQLAEREAVLDEQLKNMQYAGGCEQLNEIKELILSENKDLTALLDKSEEKLMRREADIQNYQEDFYRKTATPYIRQFISLGDLMRRVLYDGNSDGTEQYWQLQFGKIVESIHYVLKDFSVKTYQEAEKGEAYQPERQDVIRYKETTDPELDKKISASVNPGYIWTLPYIIRAKVNGEPLPLKEYEMIIRKEEVETFKLK